MRLIDEKGRLFGLMNVIDLSVVALACLVGAVIYTRLIAPDRIAPEYALPHAPQWTWVEVRLPADEAWMTEVVAPGMVQRDGRSGEPVAEVAGVTRTAGGLPAITVRVRAAKDPKGRLFFGDICLIPGETIRIESDAAVIEGRIYRVWTQDP